MAINLTTAFIVPDAVGVTGNAVTPIAGQVIADTGPLSPGIYVVSAACGYGPTADVIDNFALFVGTRRIMTLPAPGSINTLEQAVVLQALRVLNGDHITVVAIAAGAAGSVYRATIVVCPRASI